MKKITIELTDSEVTRTINALKLRATQLNLKSLEDQDEAMRSIHKEMYLEVKSVMDKIRTAIKAQ